MRLREVFATKTQLDLFQKVVIVSAGDQRVGLVVDQVIGDHQTVIKSLSKLHATLGAFSGATILGDVSIAKEYLGGGKYGKPYVRNVNVATSGYGTGIDCAAIK